jgi:hypothetical protein
MMQFSIPKQVEISIRKEIQKEEFLKRIKDFTEAEIIEE